MSPLPGFDLTYDSAIIHGGEDERDMLPTHGRYDYSNITTRPDYAWPGGRRLAVYLALNIEAFGFGMGKGAAIAPPDQAQSHSVYSWLTTAIGWASGGCSSCSTSFRCRPRPR